MYSGVTITKPSNEAIFCAHSFVWSLAYWPIDYLYAEWNNKAVGFVSYGGVGGARAAEHLRLVAGELQMADVRQQVALSMITEFENFSVFKPGDYNLAALNTMFDQVIAWSAALAPLRAAPAAA